MDDKAIEVMARAICKANYGHLRGFAGREGNYERAAQAALAAYHAHLKAEGFAIVPVEPTDAMIHAALARECSGDMYFSIYCAMIAAAVSAKP